jgi:UPF0755 protein
MSPFAILLTFTSGISIVHPVTVREGENIYEIAQDLREKNLISSARTFLALCNNQEFIASLEHFKNDPPHSLEGYLLPDTYFLDRTLSEQDIAKKMVHHFFEFWGPDQEKQSQEKGIPRNNLITLASMIEKETGAAEERPLISSVFYNRLRKKMKLQSDPTTIYGIWNRYHGSLHKADLREKNEYNTYQISGLPAGPIANPGKEAISAALKPAESNFLYFVSHNDGTHEFTSNYADHLAAVRKFQLNPKAREGKSWRDLARRQNNRSHSIAQ